MHVFISVLVPILAFLSFHFMYSDGWSNDGTWTYWKTIREKIWPSNPEDRVGSDWWHPVAAYGCAFLAATLTVVDVIANSK